MTKRIVPFILFLLIVSTSAVRAQSFEVGAHFLGSQWSEFRGTDLGVGGRLTWKPVPILGLEGELNLYPVEFPDSAVPFSTPRIEGLFAITAGPRLQRVRPFIRASVGFLRMPRDRDGVVCLAIFPPPLACLLAAGGTLPVFDLGGGVEVSATASTFFRVDAGVRILKYPGPTIGPADEVSEEGFFGNAFRFMLGAGWRF